MQNTKELKGAEKRKYDKKVEKQLFVKEIKKRNKTRVV